MHTYIPKTISTLAIFDSFTHGQEVIDEAQKLVKKGRKAPKKDKKVLLEELERQMKEAAKVLDFERAMELRDMIEEIKDGK